MKKANGARGTIFYRRADSDLWELAERLLKDKSPRDLSSLVAEESVHSLMTQSTPL